MTRFLFAATLLALTVSKTNGFIVPISKSLNVRSSSTSSRNVLLTEEEVEIIFKSATDCAESECSVEDVSSLLSDLKDQKKQMEARLKMIENMVYKLDHLNEAEDREVDAVRQTVRDFLRVFNSDSPAFFPTGWVGDVGDGPTTAYDALPPKPYKE